MALKNKRNLSHFGKGCFAANLAVGLLTFTPINVFATTSAAAVASVQQQKHQISGTITDESGEPIVGASVTFLNGGAVGTVTDIDGKFTLNAAPGTVLKITYVGFTQQAITVKSGTTTYNVQLREDQQSLNEVVVVGYGVQKKANLTGSVTSINSEALSSRPVSSVSSALAGTMSGVTAIQRTGEPGAQNSSITIRGQNSINAASPLVIVDGVPGSMNNIDPQDIESVSVLKDAASAAIYGVQAANGVIVITTKKGQNGQKTRVDYSGLVSFTSPTDHFKFLGAADYAMLYNEATLNENPNAKAPFSEEDIQKFRDGSDPIGHPNSDWYDATFKKSAIETQHNVAISGGTQNTTYMGSLGYTYQDGMTHSRSYNRYNGRMNIDSKLTDWLSIGLNASAYRGITEDSYKSAAALVQHVNRIPPTYPIYNKDGSFNYNGMENPVALSGKQTGSMKRYDTQFFGTAYLEVRPIAGLSLKALYNIRHDNQDYRNFKNSFIYGQGNQIANSGVREAAHNYYNWNWYTTQLLANYMKTFAKHHTVNALLGYEQVDYNYRYTKASRQGGGSNDLQESLNTLDSDGQKNEDGGYDTGRRSYFGRIQYDFDDKYLFEANMRADGSSIFPKANRWGYFPAVSAAWRLSEEQFIKNGAPWISNLKVRLGWGKTGNEELAADNVYPAIPTYSYGTSVLGSTLTTTTHESRYVNSDLKWATVTNYELGIEAGFLDNKFGFELDLYKKKTNDMLLQLPIQGVIGMEAPYQNAGSVENTGFDLNLFHNNRINKDFRYSVNMNISYVHNEIVDMSGTEGPSSNDKIWYLEGHPIGAFYGYVADGYFNTADELAKGPKRTNQEKVGDIRYKDFNDDGKITAADRKVIGKNFPSWTGGLNINLYYKNFDLMMLWQSAFDVDAYFTGEAAYAFFNSGKVLERHLDRWTPEHHNASYPRLTRNSQTNFATSSFWLEDASYVRLKNITLGYTLPKSLIGKLGLSNAKVFMSGENLLTFDSLDGIDPEAPFDGRGAFYSNVKKISFGLKVSF
uniref:TonB-dependent receptor n=5 Tax=unclassified Prevotella TaxID=2638335 RepID=A0AB33JNP8_9BACT